ncbi:prepilin-type N-terminal cleavage/methylation domain-containing protein [Pelagicoccus sp. SDUM812005]|uniref:type IV pilus modification PilV family protein n=1 Tax=Pelagicoccus sp. SDUM812005 TaxID=3041257 RepID=UPI00280E3BE4|nr:prepilin-type N-terminal cleavage/methylation domain-containing protein [Pelagicoccus sp. SDUM812005]MDQ8183404.1 prepilin-type N-terminal cleavage/methylation domain-containing protein [Pelagicoccus sp. SDUM812005]
MLSRTAALSTQRLKRARRFGRAKSGFTLVEMMVAIFVLGIVLAAAFSTVAQALQTVETSRDYARVAQILQSEMEDLRTMSWSQLEAQQAADGGVVSIDLTEEFNEAFGARYRAFRYIQDRYSDQKQATIWVYWWDARGNFRIKQTVSWFTENGLHDYYYRSF